MKKLIIFFATFLFAANLINVNFFQQKDKLDILLSLDNKFNGKVIEINENQFLIKGIKSTNEYFKEFNNFFVKKIKISPTRNGVLILLNVNTKYKTSVALTPDGYGIRFRIVNIQKPIENIDLPTNKEYKSLDFVSYIVSLIVLIIIAVILFIFKKKVKNLPIQASDIKVLFQKPLDTKNRIALIEFNNRKYLVIVGNSNILLDIFDENMVNISTKEEFDEYLKKEVDNRLDYLKQYIENAEKLKELNERF